MIHVILPIVALFVGNLIGRAMQRASDRRRLEHPWDVQDMLEGK